MQFLRECLPALDAGGLPASWIGWQCDVEALIFLFSSDEHQQVGCAAVDDRYPDDDCDLVEVQWRVACWRGSGMGMGTGLSLSCVIDSVERQWHCDGELWSLHLGPQSRATAY